MVVVVEVSLASSPSLLDSQSRSIPCTCGDPSARPPGLATAEMISSVKVVEAEDKGGGVGVVDFSAFSPLERTRPVILRVGLMAGLCFLRGLEASSSVVLADRLLLVVVVAVVGDVVVVVVGLSVSEVGLAPNQGLVKGLIS